MAENAVQMVQRIPSPRGDKNGADINLALDALEMAFTHQHVNAFAIVSGDSDFIPLVNELKEYGKTVFVVGGKAFTSTILQQNCHEFISYEGLLDDLPRDVVQPPRQGPRDARPHAQGGKPPQQDRGPQRQRSAPLDIAQAMPLVERALEVLERRSVQPQLGLLKSTMLQLMPSFNEKVYGAHSFSEFVEMLKKADFVNVSGSGGRYIIERKASTALPEKPQLRPEGALPFLRDVRRRIDWTRGKEASAPSFSAVGHRRGAQFDWKAYGFGIAEVPQLRPGPHGGPHRTGRRKGTHVYLGAGSPACATPAGGHLTKPHPLDERQPFVAGRRASSSPILSPYPPEPPRRSARRNGRQLALAPPRKPRTTRRKVTQ
jgi:hypothetical protein